MPTLRQQIIAILSETEMNARELSKTLGLQEKEIYLHLSHVMRSLAAQGKSFQIRPSQCLKCGYIFKDRPRFTPPGRCPRCKGTYLQKPSFRISSCC